MPAETMLPSIRKKIHFVDSELALANVRSMDDWLSSTAAQPRLNTVLLSVFAVLALLIATIGIYGVLAYSVNQRTREIGLRMALGATRNGVLKLVIREGMAVVLAGVAAGIVGGLALGRAISSLVFGVTAHDPATFAAVVVVLAAVALAACLIPARRAAGVDPLEALRHE
jgi:putative ABC transport system permease protein